MKRAMFLLQIAILMCSNVNAQIFWQAYVVKNNEKGQAVIAPGVEVSTASVRIDLPGLPVKATVDPVVGGTAPDGTEFVARLLEVEFLDGTGAAVGAVCATGHPGRGNITAIMIRRYNLLYEVDLTCLELPEDPSK